jgi:3',5'-cyclic AMP phosphodiesterase CpdA
MPESDITTTPFRFAVINDLHYTDAVDRPWLEGLMDHVNGGGAELCLALGDLVEHGTIEQLTAARQILQRLRMPFYTVPGNHDGPPERPAGLPDGAGLETYENLFPGRRNYTFEHKGWQFIALDTSNGSAWTNVPLRPETLAFARQAATRLDPRRPTILFTHFPIDPAVRFNMLGGPELLAALRPLNLRIVFSGHFHGITQSTIGGIEVVTNRCCSMRREIHDGSNIRGYYLCTANADGTVARQFIQYTGQ